MRVLYRPRQSRQRGITLIIVLLILVVVTLVGIGGAQIALLGERSTRYDRDYLVASQAAEAALRDAEMDIAGTGAAPTRSTQFTPTNTGIFVAGCGSGAAPTGNQGLCAPAAAGKPVWATVNFLDTSTAAQTAVFGSFSGNLPFQSNAGVSPELPPRYIIEVVDDTGIGNSATAGTTPKLYRITAMGFGPRKEVQVAMQSVFRKPQ